MDVAAVSIECSSGGVKIDNSNMHASNRIQLLVEMSHLSPVLLDADVWKNDEIRSGHFLSLNRMINATDFTSYVDPLEPSGTCW